MIETPLKIIRIGLSLVFLANGLAAFIAPQEFKELIEASFVSQLLPFPMAVFLLIIGINDLSLSVLLFVGKYQKYILAWAMIWLATVIVIITEPLAILEHIGFFAMALALWISVASNDEIDRKDFENKKKYLT